MTFDETIIEAKKLSAVYRLERFLTHRTRKSLVRVTLTVFIIAVIAKVAVFWATKANIIGNLQDLVAIYLPYLHALIFITLAVFLKFFFIEAFYYSNTDFDLDSAETERRGKTAGHRLDFEASMVVLAGVRSDLTEGFLSSYYGRLVLSRLGVSYKDVKKFLKDRKRLDFSEVSIDCRSEGQALSLSDLARAIIKKDLNLAGYLSFRGISESLFVGATDFVASILKDYRINERYWWRDRLGRIPGIGKDWAYGELVLLRRYAFPVESVPEYRALEDSSIFREEEAVSLETVLARSRGANAVVVGESNEEAWGPVVYLSKLIKKGEVMPELENKRIFILDTSAMLALATDRTVFETGFLNILGEAQRAGNIIVVVSDLPGFVEGVTKIGSNFATLIEGFASSPNLNIVATASISGFHQLIENNKILAKYFEKIAVRQKGDSFVLDVLKREALRIEAETGVFFTYQAIVETSNSASRYFVGDDTLSKAGNLLQDSASAVVRSKAGVVLKRDIQGLVESKTGVPTGEISLKEKDILLNLEKALGARVVGQPEAVEAISSAMRRSRSGVGNPKRPMGSFLFLGPTGVGKTETTKALASSFFGNEDSIMRLDMSEYRTADSLDRLIGSFSSGKPGVLSTMLRDHPYGVLLLDEFEKTNKEVIDLFLQVLDEGVFSDMSGAKVNARNLIIVATSNAGSQLIWDMVGEGRTAGLDKKKIVDQVVAEGVFKPELLNRFDGVIIFRPLGPDELKTIAGLMLKKLQKRLLSEKQLDFVITAELIEALVKIGSDPKFGARPINRAIQDKVESIIADRIIKGELPSGSKIVFGESDISKILEN